MGLTGLQVVSMDPDHAIPGQTLLQLGIRLGYLTGAKLGTLCTNFKLFGLAGPPASLFYTLTFNYPLYDDERGFE